MSVSRIDLLNQELPRAFRGYERTAVDRLLQDMADTFGRVGDEKVALKGRIASLEAQIAEYRQREGSLRDTLVATQRMSEDIRAAAQKEAQLILDTARAKAEELLTQGAMRLTRITEEIDSARKLKLQFESQLRGVLDGHIRLLAMDAENCEELEALAARLRHAVLARKGAQGRNGSAASGNGAGQGTEAQHG